MPTKRANDSNQVVATIFDVAQRAGVSYGTVSRVINNSPHVKPETRQKILNAMDELNYVVNKQAQSLAGGRSQLIGVIAPELGNGYMGQILRGIDAELSLNNLDMVLYTTHRIVNKQSNYISSLAKGMVAGLLLIVPRGPVDNIGILSQENFPFVLIDHQGDGQNCPAVGVTNWQGAFNATDYLIQLGHRRIGFITGLMDMGCSVDRLDGYRSALKTNHIPFSRDLICEGDFYQSSGYAGVSSLLDQPNAPTAIFCSNDEMAMGAIDAVRNRGKRVPEDISIIGFDDIPQSTQTHPALTTVRQPLETIGKVSVQMLLELLEHPGKKVKRIELPTELVIRCSCARFNG
jgi:LacI family transcriptional regulator